MENMPQFFHKMPPLMKFRKIPCAYKTNSIAIALGNRLGGFGFNLNCPIEVEIALVYITVASEIGH